MSNTAASFDRVTTYERVAQLVGDARAALSERRIQVHRDCSLSRAFKAAEKLHSDWASGTFAEKNIQALVTTGYALRIAESVLAVQHDDSAGELLTRVAGSSVDLGDRSKSSQGKDALWELELLALFRRYGVDVQITEPDLVVKIEGADYALACKKVYSEKGVEAQIRKGIRQIESAGIPGLIALNIDDLAPEHSIYDAPTIPAAMDGLAAFILKFIQRHQPVMQRYVHAGRCDGVFVSVACPIVAQRTEPRFYNGRQTTIWTLDSIDPAARQRINRLRSALPPGSVF